MTTKKLNKKHIEPIPEEFANAEEAAAFWETHDVRDYPEAFKPVQEVVEFKLRKVTHTVTLDKDVAHWLSVYAHKRQSTIGQALNELVRKGVYADMREMIAKTLSSLRLKDRSCFPSPDKCDRAQ